MDIQELVRKSDSLYPVHDYNLYDMVRQLVLQVYDLRKEVNFLRNRDIDPNTDQSLRYDLNVLSSSVARLSSDLGRLDDKVEQLTNSIDDTSIDDDKLERMIT